MSYNCLQLYYVTVILLECGMCDISRVLVLTRNSEYSALSVEDAVPHVDKWRGTDRFARIVYNFVIMKAIFGGFFSKNVILYENKMHTTI